MAKSPKELDFEQVQVKRRLFPYYVDLFIDKKEDEHLSPSSLLEYLRDYQTFFTWLISEGIVSAKTIKDIPLSSLETLQVEDITNFTRYLRRDRKNKSSSIDRKLASLKSLFHYLQNIAEDENRNPLLQRNVMLKIAIKSKKKSLEKRAEEIEPKILQTDDEFDEFLDFVKSGFSQLPSLSTKMKNYHKHNWERDAAIVSLILGSGLRVGEICSLTVDKVDMVNKTVQVIRKGGKEDEETVRFSEQARMDLQAYLDIRKNRYKVPDNEKSLFVTLHREDYGTPMVKHTIQVAVKKYATYFGKSQMTVHKLRHSFATRYHRNVNNVPMLQRQLGHSDQNTTMLYTHIGKDDMSKALEQMEQRIFK